MVRRALIVVALTVSVAIVAIAIVAFTGHGTNRPPASHADVYKQLAQQLKGHLSPLVPAKTTKKHPPSVQVPAQQGYTCEVAASNGCSLHPCVKYAQSLPSPSGDVAVTTSATAGGCSNTAKAAPRAIPIVAP